MLKRCILAALLLFLSSCNSDGKQNHFNAIVEGNLIKVPALVGGTIIQQKMSEGQSVNTNDLLVQIDTTELMLQKAQLNASISELSAQQKLATGQVRQAKLQQDYLAQRRQRIQQLVSNQSAARQQLDDVDNQYQQAGIAKQNARLNLQVLAAKLEQLRVQIRLLDKKINDAAILAPGAGRVAELFYEIGEAVAPMSPVAEVVGLKTVTAKIYLPQNRLSNIRYQQEVSVRVDGHDGTLPGQISWISPRAEFTPKAVLTDDTRSSLVYAVTIDIPNENEILKHGMPVEIVLEQAGD